jgi:SAM-dependent methyltransferase
MMHTALTPEWIRLLPPDLEGSAIAVVGPDAAAAGSAIQAAGGRSLLADGEGFVLLADGIEDPGSTGLAGVEPDSLDLVVLRRAWSGRPGVLEVMRAARRALRPGGRLLALEVDAGRLLESSVVRYPLRLRFDHDPDAAARLRGTTVPPAALMIDAVRAGFRDVVERRIDETRAWFASVDAYRQAIAEGAWPSLAAMAPEGRARLLEAVEPDLRAAAPIGEVADREPWIAVTGVRP